MSRACSAAVMSGDCSIFRTGANLEARRACVKPRHPGLAAGLRQVARLDAAGRLRKTVRQPRTEECPIIGCTRALFTAALTGLLAAAAHPAAAQGEVPTKPIRLIVGFAAGGGNDLFARLVGQKMSELLGQSIVIENKAGAGGRL